MQHRPLICRGRLLPYPGRHSWPGLTCSASTSAMCFVGRPVKCSICWWQETPAMAIGWHKDGLIGERPRRPAKPHATWFDDNKQPS